MTKEPEQRVRMPWSGWIVVIALAATLSPYGWFIILLLCAPLVELFRDVRLAWPAIVSVANAIGVNPIFIWPATAVFGAGLLFSMLALRKPGNPFYKHVAILLLGFLLLAAISIYRFRGWAGI
jgi:hypothetical protein